jgi:hypothetical protein
MKKARPEVQPKGGAPMGRGKARIEEENATDSELWALLAKRLGIAVPDPNKMLRDVVLRPPGAYDWLFFMAQIGMALAEREPEFERPQGPRHRRGPGKHLLDESKSTPEALRKRKQRWREAWRKLTGQEPPPERSEEYWRLREIWGMDPDDVKKLGLDPYDV